MIFLEHNHIKRNMLYQISNKLEALCCLLHPLVNLEIVLTGRYCNLSELSMQIDKKYKLGVWKTRKYKYFERKK